MTATRERLVAALTPVVEAAGADLEDLTIARAGSRQVVRLVVDRDGGVSLDDVAELSKVASGALDALDAAEPQLLSGAYVLEVSSPGVDRPLTEPRHWRRNVGRLVRGHTVDGTAVEGRLRAADEAGVQIETAAGPVELSHATLARGEVLLDFRGGETA